VEWTRRRHVRFRGKLAEKGEEEMGMMGGVVVSAGV
jgi:hypothetical protein